MSLLSLAAAAAGSHCYSRLFTNVIQTAVFSLNVVFKLIIVFIRCIVSGLSVVVLFH